MGIIVGISGQARAGKDTTADYLVKKHGFVKVGLADPMKRFCKEVFDFTDAQLYGDERDDPDYRYLQKSEWRTNGEGVPEKKETYLTPRYALQTLGTEWGRDCYDNIWIENGIRVARELLNGYAQYSAKDGLKRTEKITGLVSGVVFSDIRFWNEFEAIKKAGGLMVRVKRPGFEGSVGVSNHASETQQKVLADTMFDVILENTEDFDFLYRQVEEKIVPRSRR